MLTVKEINEVSFGKAGFTGYRPEDVDNFIDQVAESFQELLNERDAAVKQVGELAALNSELAGRNADAQKKLSILAQRVESYRHDEEGIKEAIISAQRMSNDLIKEAQSKADAIIQDARAQAESKLLEANEEARKITTNAQDDAAKAAKDYAKQAETKRTELEEIKRQVTAFRSSLLEMYKKHLECIDHIPVFRQKEERREPIEYTPEPEPVQEPAEQPVNEAVVKPVAERVTEYEPVQFSPEPAESAQLEPEAVPEPQAALEQDQRQMRRTDIEEISRSAQKQRQEPPQARTLNDRVNYVQEQLRPSMPPDMYLDENDLSSVGIDLNAHSNIPEALIQAKRNNYSDLPFGDSVELDNRKRKR